MRISDWSSDVCSSDLLIDLAPSGVALVGINQGRLGFMVDVPPAEIAEIFAAIFAGKYVREDRLMLEARVLREKRPPTFVAMNDVVIRNQAAIRMLERSEERRVGKEWGRTCRFRW